MSLLERLRQLFVSPPVDDPEADERRRAAPRPEEPGVTPDEPKRSPDDERWISTRERLRP
jgi:hypothetical protein